MRHGGSRRRRVSIGSFVVICAMFGAMGLLMLNLKAVDPPTAPNFLVKSTATQDSSDSVPEINGVVGGGDGDGAVNGSQSTKKRTRRCATVEEMGKDDFGDGFWRNSLRVRRIINQHFVLNGIFFLLFFIST